MLWNNIIRLLTLKESFKIQKEVEKTKTSLPFIVLPLNWNGVSSIAVKQRIEQCRNGNAKFEFAGRGLNC